MAAGENVAALARELKVRRKLLYDWRDRVRSGGAEALESSGRPRKGSALAGLKKRDELAQARQRIAELERKIGEQEVDLDFFQRALRQVRALPQGPGRVAAPSTKSSKR